MEELNAQEAWNMVDVKMQCKKFITLAPREISGSMILSGMKTERCDGRYVLMEQIPHKYGVDLVYICSRCGNRKIITKGQEDLEIEEIEIKTTEISDAEQRIREANC